MCEMAIYNSDDVVMQSADVAHEQSGCVQTVPTATLQYYATSQLSKFRNYLRA